MPAATAAVTPAHHSHRTICERAYSVRVHVKAQFGQAGAGRNICRFGIPTGERPRGTPRRATTRERARYLRALEALDHHAPPYLVMYVGAPHVGPGHALTVHYRPTGLAACIDHAESDGDPQASNGTHWGRGQWDENAWIADNGLAYASSPLGATGDEQLLVLSYGLVHHGCAQWCPFDPC